MKEIKRRDFEVHIEHDINVIVCYIPMGSNNKKCLEELDTYKTQTPEILYSQYDISVDYDIMETYEIFYTPYILIFKDGILVNKFEYKNIDDFKKKLDLKTLIKNNQKG